VYARVTLLEIDTMRISVDDALTQFETTVLPEAKAQPGFEGLFAFTTPEGKAMLISFWDTPDEADATSGQRWYNDALAEFMTLFRSAPGRERYEVRIAIPPVQRVNA
jgi:hypothetical protein